MLTDCPHIVYSLADLKPGDHLCCLYQTEEEHRDLITPFLRQGLEQNEKVFYIVDERTAETILNYLTKDGVDVSVYINKGQLVILTVSDSYMKNKVFDPDMMIELLKTETEKALTEGYSALRVTGEMSWALRGLPGSKRLIEYEFKLNNFFPFNKALALCQYDMRKFIPEMLIEVLETHPIAVIGTGLYNNYYYIYPEKFQNAGLSKARLENWIDSIKTKRFEKEYRQLAEITSVYAFRITFSSDGGSYIETISSNLTIITGYTMDEVRTIDLWAKMIHADDSAGFMQFWKNILSGKTDNYEARLFKKDGDIIWLKIFGLPVWDYKRDHVISIIGAVQNITEQKSAEKLLQLQSEIAKNLTEGVYLIRASDGIIVYANPRFEEIFGYNAGELIGRHVAVVNAPTDKSPEDTAKEITDLLRNNKSWRGEIENVKKDGTLFWCYASVSSFKHMDYGEVWISVHTDITERKKIEEKLKKHLNELELFHRATIDREKRILELKEKIEELEEKLGMNMPDN